MKTPKSIVPALAFLAATLALKSGVNLGTGAMTVKNGGTLEVTESATVTLNGNLTLNDGAALSFNFTDRKTAPVLALASGKTATIGSTVYVNVSATGINRPRGGEHVLTTCGGFSDATVELAAGVPDWVTGVSVNGDGNIVLDVKSSGTIFIIR